MQWLSLGTNFFSMKELSVMKTTAFINWSGIIQSNCCVKVNIILIKCEFDSRKLAKSTVVVLHSKYHSAQTA